MRPKSMILILIALGCGLVASIGISQVMERNSGSGNELKTAPIYVATIDMSAGEELNASKVKLEEWPVDKIPEGAVTNPEQLDNQSPLQPLYAGEPLMLAKLARSDTTRGNASKIRAGHRVMSINVDAASAVAGLIWPGDHVDVMVFQRGSRTGGDRAEAVLQNVEVFAVNDQIQRNVDSDGNSIQARTVSLLVTPEQAEELFQLTQMGVLTLSLRHPEEVAVTKRTPKIDPAASLSALSNLLPNLPLTTTNGSGLPVSNEPKGPEFVMEVLQGGATSVQRFTWDERDGLPNELKQAAAPPTAGSTVPPSINLQGLPIPGSTPGESSESGAKEESKDQKAPSTPPAEATTQSAGASTQAARLQTRP